MPGSAKDHIADLDRMRLDLCERMWLAGSPLGATAALYHSVTYGVALPRWAVGAALVLVCDLLKREKSEKRGRSAGGLARYRQDYIDFIRWNEVISLEEKQKTLKQQLADFERMPVDHQDFYRDELKRAKWLGQTRTRIFECVSEMLQGTEASGSPLSIKRSFLAVERNNRHPTEAYRYVLLEQPLLTHLNIDADFGVPKLWFPWRKSDDLPPLSAHRAKRVVRTKKRVAK